MTTFYRANLPQHINHNGKTYVRGEKTTKSIKVAVLSTRLKGAVDLHGQPYKPNEYYFNPQEKSTATSHVLKLMDRDYSYCDALNITLGTYPKLTRQELEAQLNQYI